MAVVLVSKTDPFEERFNQRANRARHLGAANLPMDYSHVRRPLRGMLPKQETFATIEVFERDGTPVPLINAGSRIAQDQIEALLREKNLQTDIESVRLQKGGTEQLPEYIDELFRGGATAESLYPSNTLSGQVEGYRSMLSKKNKAGGLDGNRSKFLAGRAYSLRYSNFLLTGSQESRQEKFQIMETFGVPYIFFMGERPRIYQYSGILLNSLDFQWRNEFWANYDEVLRGTRLVDRGARVVLTLDDIVAEGYILQANATEDSQVKELVQFQFQFFVTNYTSLANLGDPQFPTPAAVQIDTTYWLMESQFSKNQATPTLSNADAMRKSNLDALAKRQLGGDLGFMGNVAKALATANTVLGQASQAVESVVGRVSRFLNSRQVRLPVGSFPLLQEIQNNPALLGALEGTGSVGALVSEDSKKLFEGFATDAGGRPSFFVQDAGIIKDLTKAYNQQSARKIRIATAIPAFVAPTNPNYYGGRISDNTDEYMTSAFISTLPKTPDQTADLTSATKNPLELNQVIDEMAKALKDSGLLLSSAEMTALEVERTARSVGVLQIGVIAGSFGLSALTAPPQPPEPAAPYMEPPKGIDVSESQAKSTETADTEEVVARKGGATKVNEDVAIDIYEEDVDGNIVRRETQKTKVLRNERVDKTGKTDTSTASIPSGQPATQAELSRWMSEARSSQA